MSYYVNAVADDLRTWFEDDEPLTAQEVYDMTDAATDYSDLAQWINDTAWINDGITGNGSGSYTANRAEAREIVLANIEEVVTAYDSFCDIEQFGRAISSGDWESMDVTARCNALYEASEIVASEIMDAINDNYDELVARGEVEPDAADAC